MNWSNRLPTISGYYFFRDIDTELEQGIGYVYAPRGRNCRAEILIPVSKIDGAEPYISSCIWDIEELTNDCWEWKGPLDV